MRQLPSLVVNVKSDCKLQMVLYLVAIATNYVLAVAEKKLNKALFLFIW